ncbi:MAG: 2',5' RNA ligase family [Bacteroidetes bacterium ADurb.Bin174]|nr:RNA 2',3'-cyclic phosphodiesterase [Bacteroidales bacterium]OQB30059.1 MAG: 2',5' RNA ligase family [Bacteroidetes bacterium ADurb.Bin174]
MKRLFIAIHIKPSEEFLDVFDSIKEQLSDESIKWVEEENIHLTLRFIGEVDEDKARIIADKLHHLKPSSPIIFNIEGLQLFRNFADPKVIVTDIKPTQELSKLAEEINDELLQCGISLPEKPFTPHLTLGRIKRLRDKKLLQELISDLRNHYFQQISCTEFILFESILRPQGPIYKKIATYSQ